MNTLPPGHAAFLATHLSLLLSEKTNSIDWPQRPFTDVHKQRGKTQPFRTQMKRLSLQPANIIGKSNSRCDLDL